MSGAGSRGDAREEVDPPLWERLNYDRPIERRVGKLAMSILAVSYAIATVAQLEPGDEVWPRVLIFVYALVGALGANAAPDFWVRHYVNGLAFLLPVGTSYITSVSDPGLRGVGFTALMVFVAFSAIAKARDLLIVAAGVTIALLLVPGPTEGLSMATVWSVWGAAIGFGVCMTLAQISQRNELTLTQQRLAAARDRAERANEAKSAFLAQMSHEIRTPMNGVMGIAELLRRRDLDPTSQQYIKTLHGSARVLRALVNDILDSAKLEAGKLELEALPFDPVDLVASVVDLFKSDAEKRGLSLVADIQQPVPPAVVGDAARLQQVLTNLVSNALKFTQQGQVRVQLRASEGPDGAASLVFAVQDTGIGIPPEKQRAVFEVFSQADSSITRRFGGTGLGLHISLNIVTLMGGCLELNSKAGEGSTFSVHVDLPRSNAPVTSMNSLLPVAQASQPLHVLVADDNAVNLMIAEAMLEALGHTSVVVDRGAKAIAALQEQRFDLLLLDLEMPEMDGLETVRRIRAHADSRVASLPVIALTAHVNEDHRRRGAEAGMTGYLGKPYEASELQAAIDDAMAEGVRETTSAVRATA